jgi:hypothetical protein
MHGPMNVKFNHLTFFSTDGTKMIQNLSSLVMFPFLLIFHAAAIHSWQFTMAHILQHAIPVLTNDIQVTGLCHGLPQSVPTYAMMTLQSSINY